MTDLGRAPTKNWGCLAIARTDKGRQFFEFCKTLHARLKSPVAWSPYLEQNCAQSGEVYIIKGTVSTIQTVPFINFF